MAKAPGRGRDLSVYRVHVDSLGGTIRQRVIIQCKHWLSKSVGAQEITALREQMRLWEPPRVDVHVIATSERFTSDAVAIIEKHNQSDSALKIEMWPESHLDLASKSAWNHWGILAPITLIHLSLEVINHIFELLGNHKFCRGLASAKGLEMGFPAGDFS